MDARRRLRKAVISMQTRVLQIKVRTLNCGKTERLLQMQQAFTDAVRLHLDAAYAIPKPSVSSLHDTCYREARECFALPASTIQQARDKALSIYRSVQARRRQGKKASQPKIKRLLPLRLATENLRIFPERNVVRVTQHPAAFSGFPSSSLIDGASSSVCRMRSLRSFDVVPTGISCWLSRVRMF